MSLTSKDLFVRGQHVVQIMLCIYGAAVSYVAITKLKKYEETAQKLAEWSNLAATELRKTRTTQAAGAIAIFLSLLASVTLAIFPSMLAKWVRLTLSPALLITVLAARRHIKGYWAPRDGKTVGTRVPLPKMEDYNEAQRKTQDLLQVLEYLEYSWVAASFVNGMVGS